MKTFTKIATSKPVGKILDSKIGKVGVKVGNKIISGAKSAVKMSAAPLVKEFKIQEAKDKKYREEAMKYNNDYIGRKLPNNIKIKK